MIENSLERVYVTDSDPPYRILFCTSFEFISPDNESQWIGAFPLELRKKILAYKNFEERRKRIISKWMFYLLWLQFGTKKLEEDMFLSNSLFWSGDNAIKFFAQLQYASTGQPFLELSDIHFSTSHNQEAIVAVASRQKIGVDAECRRTLIHDDLLALLHPQEYQFWKDGGSSGELALSLWTMKEAASKALGVGVLKEWSEWSCLNLNAWHQEGIWIYESCTELPSQTITICRQEK